MINCDNCGKEIKLNNSKYEDSGYIFCSKKCRNAFILSESLNLRKGSD